MPKNSAEQQSVMLDTSFLITLANKERVNHDVAVKYHKEFIKRSYDMMLSTIVISEYQQMQTVTDLMVSGNYIPVPFNFEDAIKTAEMAFNVSSDMRASGERANAKDDIKIIAQAEANGFTFLITDDDSTMYKYCKKLNDAGIIKLKPIKLSDGLDMSIFNNGQTGLEI